jgi:hypothetical protein
MVTTRVSWFARKKWPHPQRCCAAFVHCPLKLFLEYVVNLKFDEEPYYANILITF